MHRHGYWSDLCYMTGSCDVQEKNLDLPPNQTAKSSHLAQRVSGDSPQAQSETRPGKLWPWKVSWSLWVLPEKVEGFQLRLPTPLSSQEMPYDYRWPLAAWMNMSVLRFHCFLAASWHLSLHDTPCPPLAHQKSCLSLCITQPCSVPGNGTDM